MKKGTGPRALAALLTSAPTLADDQGLVMPGFSTGAAVQSTLRLSNSDGIAHDVTVTLHSAAAGEMLGAWTSPPAPRGDGIGDTSGSSGSGMPGHPR